METLLEMLVFELNLIVTVRDPVMNVGIRHIMSERMCL